MIAPHRDSLTDPLLLSAAVAAGPHGPGLHAPHPGERRTRPAPERRARPDLRVVEAPARRRITPTVGAVACVVGIFVVLFGLAAFHTILVQGQQRLDALDAKVSEEQALYQRQRLLAAQLGSPVRIVEAAMNELGMVEPGATTYLTPDGEVGAQVGAQIEEASGEPVEPDPGRTEQATGPVGVWMTVKPFLDDAP